VGARLSRLQLDQKNLFLGIGTLVLHQLGETAVADVWSAEAVAYARDLEDPLNVAHAYNLVSQYRSLAGDRPGTIAWADRAIAVAAEHGFPTHEAGSTALKGFACGSVELQRAGYEAYAATGQRVGEPMYRMGLAQTWLDQGRVAEATRELAEALVFVDETGEARHLAELYRLQAACARRSGRPDDAEADLRRAAAIASAQDARLFVLRAVADLAEVLAEGGRAGEAQTLLAPLCEGFVPEGQGPELDRARALAASIR
jgi:tetratricopeptide (TPR) repeat protein